MPQRTAKWTIRGLEHRIAIEGDATKVRVLQALPEKEREKLRAIQERQHRSRP
jgi:hypothetical protein